MARDIEIEDEIKKGLKKEVKKIPSIVWLIIPCIVCLFAFGYSLNFRLRAQATGGMIGEGNGKLVGRAIGSLDGLTRGQIEGYEAGKEEGLSAKDTSVDLSGKIKEAGKLEVLLASGTYVDILSIGEPRVNYAAILSQQYNAVFTIDLKNAEIELKEDGLHILLDQPALEFIPVGELEKKNEFQRKGFVFKPGSAEEGYIAADNSLNEILKKAQERLQTDEALLDAARSSARTQLTQLVNAVSLSKPDVFVEFRGGAGNE